jgi:2-polyprenyl-6-methoxyphenol hydroxylase-like FAD-dependent oxidoreductase
MSDYQVIVAGGGPTGLMLAGELALAGIEVAIVERRSTQDLDGSRSGGLHSRTIEVLDQRGIADRFLAEGQATQVQAFAGVPLTISDFPTRHPYGLALWQKHFERILAGWVDELGVPIIRQRQVTGFVQDDSGVEVELGGDGRSDGGPPDGAWSDGARPDEGRSDGGRLGADYLVGCDGGRSVVRRVAGIEFAGWDPTTSWLIAEVEVDQEPEYGLRPGGGIGRTEEGGPVRIVLTEPNLDHRGAPSLEDVRHALIAAEGTDYGVHTPTWISRFTDTTRQATAYRRGRVLLAGDAAHVHSPQGGQGLNIGVQDAVNLGWKLAQVVDGVSPDALLDTYHAERHPVGARVLRSSMAQVALRGTDDRTGALRDTVVELLGMDEPRRRYAGMLSGLDVHYDLGEGHPLLGRRMPDLDLVTAEGPTRVSTLQHEARPLLVRFGEAGGIGEADGIGEAGGVDITPWAGRVRSIQARPTGPWELPVEGPVAAPPAVLIRPDGYVAWVGDGTDSGLSDALTTWFGPARPAS